MASYDEVKLEDIVHGSFATFNPNTGANKDADSTPTLVVYEEGSSTALTVTNSVTNITTGRYRWQVTVAAADGFEAGKFYEVWASVTVTGDDTVTQVAPVMSFKATARVVDDLATATAQSTAQGNITDILADTNELQGDWANGGRLDLIIDATLADTNELQTDWANGGRLDLIVDATLADTNELQTDWVNGGRLDLIIDAILDDTDLIDDGTSGLAKIATDVAAILVDTSTTLDGKINTIDGIVDDILVDTAEIGVAGAGLTNINLPNQTMDIVGNITGNLSGSVGSVTGGINTSGGTITTLDALDTAQDTQHTSTLSKMLKYFQLLFRKDAAIATDNATEVTAINADGGSGAGAFANTTDSLEANRDNIGTAGAGLTAADDAVIAAIPSAATIAAAVRDVDNQSPAADSMGAYVKSIMVNGVPATSLDVVAQNQIESKVDESLANIHLDHLLAADYDPASKPGVATALLNELVESDSGVSRFTANALEQGPGGGSAPTAADIADAVWDEARTAHTTSGTFGYYLNAQISSVGGAGSGADTCTLTFTYSNGPLIGQGIADADVWIATNSSGTNVIAGTLQTNSSGQVVFLLTEGVTYYAFLQKDGINDIRGQAFTAVAD